MSQLLADGTGPLYREASGDDLGAIIERAARGIQYRLGAVSALIAPGRRA